MTNVELEFHTAVRMTIIPRWNHEIFESWLLRPVFFNYPKRSLRLRNAFWPKVGQTRVTRETIGIIRAMHSQVERTTDIRSVYTDMVSFQFWDLFIKNEFHIISTGTYAWSAYEMNMANAKMIFTDCARLWNKNFRITDACIGKNMIFFLIWITARCPTGNGYIYNMTRYDII